MRTGQLAPQGVWQGCCGSATLCGVNECCTLHPSRVVAVAHPQLYRAAQPYTITCVQRGVLLFPRILHSECAPSCTRATVFNNPAVSSQTRHTRVSSLRFGHLRRAGFLVGPCVAKPLPTTLYTHCFTSFSKGRAVATQQQNKLPGASRLSLPVPETHSSRPACPRSKLQ